MKKTYLRAATVAALVCAMMLMAACSSPQAPNNAPEPTPAAQDNDDTAADSDAAKPSEGQEAGTQDDMAAPPAATPTPAPSGNSGAFKNILSQQANLQYRVTYNAKFSGGPQGSMSGTMTQYFMGIDTMRMDTAMGEIETRMIKKGTDLNSCTNFGGMWTCHKIDLSQWQDTTADITENYDSYNVEPLPARTIAGASTQCFKVTRNDGSGTIEYCYSSDAVPLYVKTMTADGTQELTATSYTKSVSASDFELPESAGTGGLPFDIPAGLPEGVQIPGY